MGLAPWGKCRKCRQPAGNLWLAFHDDLCGPCWKKNKR